MAPSPLRGLLFNVGFGFTVSLLLMLAVIGMGVTQMAQLNSELENVVSKNNVKTRLASQMRDSIRDRQMLMHNIVVTNDPWEKDTLFLQFQEYGERYSKDRQRLGTMLNTPEEKLLMRELDVLTAFNQPIMFNVIQQALDENNYSALKILQEEAIPLQNELMESLNKMNRLQREDNETALSKTFVAYQATRNLMLVLGIVATLLASLVAVLVSRRMLTQTRQLETERQKYQTLFETNSDAVVILDDNGFTDCNPATLSLFGMDSVATFLRHAHSATRHPHTGEWHGCHGTCHAMDRKGTQPGACRHGLAGRASGWLRVLGRNRHARDATGRQTRDSGHHARRLRAPGHRSCQGGRTGRCHENGPRQNRIRRQRQP